MTMQNQTLKNSNTYQNELLKKGMVKLLLAVVLLGVIFFIPAGTFYYWEAWVYIAILIIPATLTTLYLKKTAPDLLERRLKMREKEAQQKLIVKLSFLFYIAAFVIPGLDQRFGWSNLSLTIVIIADIFILSGYFLFIWVLMENRYASRIIEVEQKQEVISTGPYAIVRHPMYVAALLIFLSSPLALGSYWAIIPASSLIFILAARIINEEKLLTQELEGYREYTCKTKYRLIPGIW